MGHQQRRNSSACVSAGVDLMANFAVTCTDVLYTRQFNGQTVSAHNTPFIAGPRLRMALGRAFTAGSIIVEPAAGAGVISMSTDEPDDNRFTSTWYGATLTVRTPDSGKALHFEYGWRELPFSYYDETTRVHRYSEREPMARLVFEF
jgi:hypothetical protein